MADEIARIMAFIERIGIRVVLEQLAGDTPLPAMMIREGALVVDLDRLEWPGDLLHEAGHIAVTDPHLRPTLSTVSNDGGEEMAAIAWSYAAAIAIGIAPDLVFHDNGYRGGAASLRRAFAAGSYVGLPLLIWFGMASEGDPPYPHMRRWLR